MEGLFIIRSPPNSIVLTLNCGVNVSIPTLLSPDALKGEEGGNILGVF